MSEKKTHATTITEFLLSRGEAGATDIEGAAATGIKEHVYRAQRITLENKGAVCPTGEKRDDGRKRPGRVYAHASFVSEEKQAEAAAAVTQRAARKAEKAERATTPDLTTETPTETPIGEQIDGGADDPLFA